MKYLITESQLDNIIFNYLDSLDLYMVKYEGDYIFWDSKESWKSSGRVLISTHRSHKDCFVNSDFVVEISTFFSLGLEESLNIIGEWVKPKVDFDINYFYSDYGAD
jgi:hypothetical protein